MPRSLAISLGTIGCLFAVFATSAAARPAQVAWSVSATPATVSESAGSASFTIQRSTAQGTAKITYATQDGDATAGSDYTARSATLRFASGQTSQVVSVPIADDSSIEARQETFSLAISSPSKGVAGSPAAVAIADNDGTVSLDTANWLPATPIFQHNFANGQGTAFDVTNTAGTRDAVVDISGSTNGYDIVGSAAGGNPCSADGASFSCTGVEVPSGGSAQVELTIQIPVCDAGDVTVTLSSLSDPQFANANSNPTLSHTFTRTLNPSECP